MDISGYIRAADNRSVVVFDVFSVLIVYPFVRQDEIFNYLEKISGREGFAKARRDAERQVRKQNTSGISLGEIYSVIGSGYSDLKEKELAAESSLCRADAEALSLYYSMKEQGKRIVLVSDRCLPRGAVEEILEKCGFTGYSELYISDEHGMDRLFDSDHGPFTKECGQVLVISDSGRFNGKNSDLQGIKTESWVSLKERYFSKHPKEKRYSKRRDVDSSLILGLDMLMWQDAPDGEYWYTVARRFGGPMAFSFANFVKRNSQGYDKILFISRDGWIPLQSYRDVGGENGEYIYCSRMLSTVLGRNNLSDRDSAFVALDYFRHRGLKGAEDVNDNPGAKRYVSEHSEELEALRREAFDSYSRYARSKAGEGKVMVADTTTMKYSSQKFLSETIGSENTGCYYAITATEGPNHIQFIDRSKQYFTWSYVNLAEFFFSSAEAPLIDVTEDGPVFQTELSEEERYRESIQPSLEKGQLDYVRYAASILGDYVFSPKALDGWLDVIISYEKGNVPHRLSGTKWGVDKGHNDYRPLLLGAGQLSFALETKVKAILKR